MKEKEMTYFSLGCDFLETKTPFSLIIACWLKYKQFLSLLETIFLNMNKIHLQASCESSLFVSTAQSVDSNRKALDTVQ